MSQQIWKRSLLVASLVAVVILSVSVWLEWNIFKDFPSQLSLLVLLLVLSAAIASYGLRVIRFYFLLSQSGVPISLRSTAVVQGIGFALSVTPGSVGEVFKLHLIEECAGTPLFRTAPVLLLDRVMESGGFLVLVFLSATALPSLQIHLPNLALLTTGLLVLLALALLRRRLAAISKVLARFSLGRRILPSLQNMWRGLESSLTPRQLVTGLTLTALARIADGLVLLFAAQMLGVALALPVAVFVIALSGLAGGISLLPGGAGAVETTMAGLLMLSGAPLPSALTITLLARMSTLWLWVAVGLGLAFILQLAPPPLPRAVLISPLEK